MKSIRMMMAMLMTVTTSLKHPINSFAQVEPYIVTTSIIQEPVAREDCILLIQDQYSNDQAQEELQANLDHLHVELSQYQETYQVVLQELQSITEGPENSIQAAQASLELVIETLYQEYLGDESFSLLSEEEQVSQIGQDPIVLEWQAYLDQLTNRQNELIAQKQAIEIEVEAIVYQIESLSSQLEEGKTVSPQLNQCLLYPYSVPKISAFSLIDDQTQPLSHYIAALDQQMKQLVPYAYQKLTFQQITDAFTQHLDGPELSDALYGKENVEIDQYGLGFYSYAKEFTSLDLEIMANKAQYRYLKDLNESDYRLSYLSMIDLKESQFNYFYQLNANVWENVKEGLASYLNLHGYIDEDSIEKVRQFHLKYQVKLVTFDQEKQVWFPLIGAYSGYLSAFQEKDVSHHLENRSAMDQETTSQNQSESGQMETTTSQTGVDTKDSLDFLKDQLISRENKNISQNNLAKPSTNTIKRPPQTTEKTQDATTSKKGGLKLPSTGERQIYTQVGLVILLVAAVFLLIVNRKRRSRKGALEEIELD